MLIYDLHVHTSLSACADRNADISGYCREAREHGTALIGFSDHAWERRVPGIGRAHV